MLPTIRKFSSIINTVSIKYPTVLPEYAYDRLKKKVEVIGHKNLVNFVNASAKDSLLKTKMQRYLAGDITALGSGFQKGVYTDISGFPTDYNTLSNTLRTVNTFLSNNGCSNVPDFVQKFRDTMSAIKSKKESVVVSNVNEE